MTFETLQNSVVVENFEIVSRVEERHEKVERLLSRVLQALAEVFFPAQLSNVVSGLRPVMAIGNVEVGYLIKFPLEKLRVFRRTPPEDMLDTVCALDVAPGLILSHLFESCLDGFLVVSESEEDRADIGILDVSEFRAIFFFLGKSVLMPLDPFLLVILNRGEANQSLLAVAVHGLLVDVEPGCVILHQVAFLDEVVEVVLSLEVN